jgi:CheY-like chemotaxis protein
VRVLFAPGWSGRLCILLVEDEWLTLWEMGTALRDSGYEVLPAEHGRQACDYIDQHPAHFTCLVTDHIMPGGVAGSEVVEYMRPLYPAIPMVLATGTPFAVGEAWLQRHSVHLLTKPYFSTELVSVVGKLMRGRASW